MIDLEAGSSKDPRLRTPHTRGVTNIFMMIMLELVELVVAAVDKAVVTTAQLTLTKKDHVNKVDLEAVVEDQVLDQANRATSRLQSSGSSKKISTYRPQLLINPDILIKSNQVLNCPLHLLFLHKHSNPMLLIRGHKCSLCTVISAASKDRERPQQQQRQQQRLGEHHRQQLR